MAALDQFAPNTRLQNEFVVWLKNFEQVHLKRWSRLRSTAPEAAMCEARYWEFLTAHGVAVSPFEFIGRGPQPDFVCFKNNTKFYVEVTCILIQTATRATKLQHIPHQRGGGYYKCLNGQIFNEVKNKTPKCEGLDAPCVVAVGTFHFGASWLCITKQEIEQLVTGETELTVPIDPCQERAVGKGYHSTSLYSAAFLKPAFADSAESARNPISALLIGGFGCDPAAIYGVAHPSPNRRIDPGLLNSIEWCRLRAGGIRSPLAAEWIGSRN